MTMQDTPFSLRVLLVPLMILNLAANGCSTMQPIDPASASPLTSVVEAGDRVRITSHDGQVTSLVVESVENDRLSDGERTFMLDQVQQLEIRKVSPGRTLALVGIVTVAGLVAFASSGGIAPVTY